MGIRVLLAVGLVITFAAFHPVPGHAQDAKKAAADKAKQIDELEQLLKRWTRHYATLPRSKKEALHKIALAQDGMNGNADLLPLLDFKVSPRQRVLVKAFVAFDFLCSVRLDEDPELLDEYCETMKSKLDVLFEHAQTARDAYKELAK